jgi:hypothetical protein
VDLGQVKVPFWRLYEKSGKWGVNNMFPVENGHKDAKIYIQLMYTEAN